MTQAIRVGFIGLNPDSHWAAMAHIPALQSLGENFEVVGVANSSPESARRTADALQLPQAFDSVGELVASPEIDLVTVTVKVPHHLELVTAALEAGKHVYCEWPLGNGLDEARKLADLAANKKVVAVAGTQARAALEIQHLRKLVEDGYVGRVLSTSIIASGGNWSDQTPAELAYLFDSKNGANMQTIPMAHTLEAMREVLGAFGPLTARFVSNFDSVKVSETGEILKKDVPDQIMIHGVLASGAALSVHYRGGVCRGTNLLWEINGTEGDIQISGELGHAQMIQLSVRGARGEEQEMQELMPDKTAYEGLPDFAGARNVAGIYARMYDDIQNNTRTAPSFQDAVALHELIDAIEQSARS